MTHITSFVGRKKESKILSQLLKSPKSEFLALYGRRRVGKTFLIREYFNSNFCFTITGIAQATTSQQLFNFHMEMDRQSRLAYRDQAENWLVAFQRLRDHIESTVSTNKKVIFIDELPWFDTHGSDFMIGLEHFWNSWASQNKNIILIVCGSAASWMINELINHKGGLHNRITQKIFIEPFNLMETEEFLQSKKCKFDRFQLIQLYMAMGGIPYYLDAILPDQSAAQNIQRLFFEKNGLLNIEFQNLYRALYRDHHIYEKIVETLSSIVKGLNRNDIVKLSGISSGGTLTKVLQDLEASGFITSYSSLDSKNKNTLYRLSDFYTLFYFNFIKEGKYKEENSWLNMIDHPTVRAWQGFTFEQVCLNHIAQIKKTLGISGIQAQIANWKGGTEGRGAQIDLLIDRRDQVINICECKFSLSSYTIDKSYAEKIRNKIAVFKEASKTKKSIFFTMITTYGVNKNEYFHSLVQNELTMDDLFCPI